MKAEVEHFAASSTRNLVSWRNGLLLWLVVALATWFQSERTSVSLAPLLLCSLLLAIDGAIAYRKGAGGRIIDVSTTEGGAVLLHFDRPVQGRAVAVRLLCDLVEGPVSTTSLQAPAQETISIQNPGKRPVIATELIVASSGLGLVRSARSHTVVATPPIQAELPAVSADPGALPVDESLRSYQFGDSMRRVHWPSTARSGTLLVRAADYVTRPPLIIVVERSESTDDESYGFPEWNGAVDRAVAMIGAALSEGRTVELANRTVSASSGSALTQMILDVGISSALSDRDELEALSEIVIRSIDNVAVAREQLITTIPGSVPVVDEDEVRIS